jgi:hypothetical protein
MAFFFKKPIAIQRNPDENKLGSSGESYQPSFGRELK